AVEAKPISSAYTGTNDKILAYATPTKPLIAATGTAFISIRSLHLIAKDGRVWTVCFSSVICTKKAKTTLITINTLSTAKNAVNEIYCNKDRPINGPATTAKFIAIAKYPIPAPRLDLGTISAANALVAVVTILKEIP